MYLEEPFTLTPEIFSPDNDGYDDFLQITYHFEKSGYMLNLQIFDSKGRFVKQLVKNELLGTDGYFTWDGTTEAKEKAQIGIYILNFEVFDMNKNLKKYKKSIVLGGKL